MTLDTETAERALAPDTTRMWPRYPTYRDSGIEWVGEVPAHWQVKRLRYSLARIEQGWSPQCENRPAAPDEWGVLKVGCVNNWKFNPNENKALPAYEEPIEEFEIHSGDIIMSRANTKELLGSAAVVEKVSPRLLLCDKLYRLQLLPNTFDGDFLVFALGSAAARYQFERDATGASSSMQNIAQSTVRDVLLPTPSVHEQRAIVVFLDRETTRIDALVAAKERLIALLREKRAALISRAVTRGLDPDVPLRDSGVPWLGQVPAHWQVKRTKFIAKLESGHTPSRQHPEYWENCTIPWMSLADVWQLRDGLREYVEDTSEYVSELGIANSSARLLPAGTVMLSRTASVGFSGIMAQPMATTQDFANWVCGPEIRSEYLLYVFRAMSHEFRRLTLGSTHQTIYMPDISQFVAPVPPRAEQDAIVDYIRHHTSKLDMLISKVEQHIEKVREYRAALIAAAVTGKIDVRAEGVGA